MSLADKFRDLGRFLSQDVSENEIKIFEYKSVKVFGSKQEMAEGEIPDEMIRQMAQQMGVSESEVRRFLGSEQTGTHHTESTHHTTSSAHERVEATGPVVRVECPDCHRTVVNRKGYCMYCGGILEQEQEQEQATEVHRTETPTTAQDVDAKYLKTDVETTRTDDDEHEGDSFMERLTRM